MEKILPIFKDKIAYIKLHHPMLDSKKLCVYEILKEYCTRLC